MRLSFIKPVYAHCDLPCGVYDPAQALIEAKSVHAIMTKYPDLDDENKTRAIFIKEERAELVEKYPDLHNMFWNALKAASECKHHVDEKLSKDLLDKIEAISKIFWETKKA